MPDATSVAGLDVLGIVAALMILIVVTIRVSWSQKNEDSVLEKAAEGSDSTTLLGKRRP